MSQKELHRDYPLRRWLVLLAFALGVVALVGRAADLQIKHKQFLNC